MSENSSELDLFETGRRSPGGEDIVRIRAEAARINAEAEKIKAENERLAAQNAAARSKSLEEEELTKWEYTIEDVKNIERLNQLGKQSWEVTGIFENGGAYPKAIMKRKINQQKNQNFDFSYSR